MNAAWSASVSGNPVLDATAPTCWYKTMKICFKGLPGKDSRQVASQAAGRGCCILHKMAGAAGGRIAGRRDTIAFFLTLPGRRPGRPWHGTWQGSGSSWQRGGRAWQQHARQGKASAHIVGVNGQEALGAAQLHALRLYCVCVLCVCVFAPCGCGTYGVRTQQHSVILLQCDLTDLPPGQTRGAPF